MKPKQYRAEYHLEETSFFDRDSFVENFMIDFRNLLQAVRLTPITFRNCINDLETKYWNIFNGTKVSRDAAEKFWKYIFASQIIPIRNLYYPNWKQATLDYRLKNDPDFARRYECWKMHQEEDSFFNDLRTSYWESLLRDFLRFAESFAENHDTKRISQEDITRAKGILGISGEITKKEINTRYRIMSKMTHPDLAGEESAPQFRVLSEARDLLLMVQSA